MLNAPSVLTMPTQLAETAAQHLIELMKHGYNVEIDIINKAHKEAMTAVGLQLTTGAPHIQPDKYYVSEVINPLQPPACFIIVDRSEADLEAQNFEHMIHGIIMVLLHQDAEVQRLVRMTWRMATAAYRVVHDKVYNNSKFYVRGIDYSPVYRRQTTNQQETAFMKDIMVRIEAHTYESF